MKSTFGRSFSVFAGILLVALTVLGGSFQMMVQDFLTDTTFDSLEQDAQIIAELAASYMEDDSLSGREFLMNLDIASKVSGSDAVICNSDGKVTICSDSLFGCKHMGLYVNEEYLQKVLSQGSDRATGLIKGLYSEERFLVALPVTAADGDTGIIIVSSPSASVNQVLTKISNIFLTTAVCVILVSVAAVSFFARRESKPLQEMAKVANAFGHGNLEARVKIEESYSEEVEELALAFNNMASSLQKSEYRRQEFVANVSHELKTPMTTIAGYTDGILDGTIPPENEKQYLQIIANESRRLSRLVRRMLDVSQLQAMDPLRGGNHFDICESMRRVLISMEKKINDRHLDVDADIPDEPILVLGDNDMITQVIYNLLENAAKFAREGSTLYLGVAMMDGKARVTVRNVGDTIPAEELPLLFERFHKSDKSRSEDKDGYGLGLYIVKTILQQHKEEINVTSEDGVTTFTFSLRVE